MTAHADVATLLARHRENGGWHALARAVTLVENAPPWDVDLPAPARPVHTIGVTGPPGAGKSTLVGHLIKGYADADRRIGVVAVDPSSPLTGGAVLGDRVRMEQHLGRDGVFVRSLASRGSRGALAGSTRNVVRLLEASGSFDVLVIETVGAGQTEVAVANVADTVVFVTVPGLGDAVQTIKAGVLEVADVVVVNMADRPGTADTMRHFRLTLGHGIPVLKTVATEGAGVDELRGVLDRRWEELGQTDSLGERRRQKELAEATLIAEEWIRLVAATGELGRAENVREAVSTILEEAVTRWQG